ncbi:MAG: holo-ACP synthase [Phycisphaerales bacterium]
MIIGHGIDIIEIDRIREMLERHGDRFVHRVYTPNEAGYCREYADPTARFAARFAAKEAALKVLGTGWRDGIAWTDVEVRNLPSGAPTLVLSGKAAEIAVGLGITKWHISLSHSKQLATASVIGEDDRAPFAPGQT